MSNINITRHDRGLDSKRIEKIIEMITEKIHDIKYDRRDVLRERRKALKEEFINLNKLGVHFNEITKVNEKVKVLEGQIKELKKTADPHKIAIAKFLRGSDETYNYTEVRDGSPADEYINERIPDIEGMKEKLDVLKNEMEESLWLAKDIEEARALYNHAIVQIEAITSDT